MKFHSLLILFILPFATYSQNQNDWIKINDEIINGYIQYDESNFNPEVVFFKKEGQDILVKYNIEEISEYYLQLIGKTFVKKITTDGRKLFFALQKDPNWLLLYEKDKVTGYVDIGEPTVFRLDEKGDIKDKVGKKELENFLLRYYDKNDYPYRLAKGKLNKLKKILPKSGILRQNRIGFFKAGLLGGINFGSYSDNFLNVLYSAKAKQNRFVLGGFAELPLNTSGNVSLLLEAKWSYFGYSNYYDETNHLKEIKKSSDFLVSYKQIEIPIIIRYYILNKDLSPFINTGLNYYHGYDIEHKYYYGSFDTPGVIQTQEFISKENLTNTSDLSFFIGVGGRFFINHRSAVYAELRYLWSSGINVTSYEIRKQELEFLLSFSF